MPQFSLAALTVLELAPPQMIEVAAACGYDAVGLRLLPAMPGGVAYPLMDDAPQMAETLRRMNDTGVRVADLEVVALREETQVAAFRPFFEAGAKLGAKNTLVAGYDADRSRLVDNFTAYCALAAEFGLTADLEFMPWTNVPNLITAIEVVQAAGRPNAGVLIDALHFDRSNSQVADITKVPTGSLHYWQICDAPAEHPKTTEELLHTARSERLFPGEGGIDLAALVRAIPRDITISIEAPKATLAKTVDAAGRAKLALDCARRVVGQTE